MSTDKTKKKFSVDQMMRNTAASLIRDFQINMNEPCFCSELREAVLTGDIARFRMLSPTTDDQSGTSLFKANYQIASIFKRYRFETDIYSEEELIKKSISTFYETQTRVAAVDFDNITAFSSVILDRAAAYISKTLGEYSDEEHRTLCRFGRRASVGIPARLACEAARWELPISGSSEQITWFDSEMSQIESVQEYWRKQKESDPLRSTYQVTSSLKLTLVPKTFKSLRSIMPNTTIGSYMSYGLGEMIRKRLKRVGYDIGSLQMRHRYLAEQASLHGLHVTADLSSASDSISVALVQRLFPADWYGILVKSRIGTVDLPDGSSIQSATFCTMGIGYTFPLQTLVFLALLKAVQSTLFSRLDQRTISVYGDDMIYAVRMHKPVVSVFSELGFVINLEKTFHEGQFRESCGGDYYRGVDVRPFQPRNAAATVGAKTYEAILYKFINGILMRWSEYEVTETLRFLLAEVSRVTGKAKLVPGDFPDDAGIKCPTLSHWSFLANAQVARPKHKGSGVYRFSYLRLTSDLRKEIRHEPYLWVGLRGNDLPVPSYAGELRPHESRTALVTMINGILGISESESLLIWKEDSLTKSIRSKHSGRRLRRLLPYVTISHTGKYTRQSGYSCFENRR